MIHLGIKLMKRRGRDEDDLSALVPTTKSTPSQEHSVFPRKGLQDLMSCLGTYR